MSLWRTPAEGDFHGVLTAAPGVSLVMFGAPACAACRVARAQVPAWSAGVADGFVYVDAHESAGLAQEFGVFHLPAFFLFRDGAFHAGLVAQLKPATWRAALVQALAASPTEAP